MSIREKQGVVSMKIVVKEVNKNHVVTHTDKVYRSECVKQFIGTDKIAEFVPITNDGLFIGVDEEGLVYDLPVNFLIETNSPYFPIEKMVGTVVFVRIKPIESSGEIYDYEVGDLTKKDIAIIDMILSDGYQAFLKKNFVDYGKGFAVVESLDKKEFEEFIRQGR